MFNNLPEPWFDEGEYAAHPIGDIIVYENSEFVRHWQNGAKTHHSSLQEALDAEVPEGE